MDILFSDELNKKLDEYHLLKHDFYHLWSMGELDMATLQKYAAEYYHHVAAFPRYISAIHSNCADIETRQILLGNLCEEDHGEENIHNYGNNSEKELELLVKSWKMDRFYQILKN